MKVGDLVKYCDSSEYPVHVAQDFDLFSIGIIVETCQHWEWAKVMWNNGDSYFRKHYFYQLEVISESKSR
mgnify:CR=1 FL=1